MPDLDDREMLIRIEETQKHTNSLLENFIAAQKDDNKLFYAARDKVNALNTKYNLLAGIVGAVTASGLLVFVAEMIHK